MLMFLVSLLSLVCSWRVVSGGGVACPCLAAQLDFAFENAGQGDCPTEGDICPPQSCTAPCLYSGGSLNVTCDSSPQDWVIMGFCAQPYNETTTESPSHSESSLYSHSHSPTRSRSHESQSAQHCLYGDLDLASLNALHGDCHEHGSAPPSDAILCTAPCLYDSSFSLTVTCASGGDFVVQPTCPLPALTLNCSYDTLNLPPLALPGYCNTTGYAPISEDPACIAPCSNNQFLNISVYCVGIFNGSNLTNATFNYTGVCTPPPHTPKTPVPTWAFIVAAVVILALLGPLLAHALFSIGVNVNTLQAGMGHAYFDPNTGQWMSAARQPF